MNVGDMVFLNTPHKAMRHAKAEISDVHKVSEIFGYDKGKVISISDTVIKIDILDSEYLLLVKVPMRKGIFKEV